MQAIFIGIRNHPWRSLVHLFAAFSVMWTLVDGFTHFIPSLNFRNIASFIIVVVISIIYTAIMIRQPSVIEIPIRHTNTKIEIKFGDLFNEDGLRVISVNEFFDSELGLPVDKKSLHGILISRCFGGYSTTFDEIVERELKAIPAEIIDRARGKTHKYPIGTSAVIAINNDRYLCFALCKTEISTCKAYSDVPTLWQALDGLWHKARVVLGLNTLVVPLVGSGLAGIGLPTRELLYLIILSIITETKKKELATSIRIVLSSKYFDTIDLNEVKRYWR